ncbi:MAG: 5-(carboxyamino)imidazole ribonucleotide mutase [Myxococcota bacterium]
MGSVSDFEIMKGASDILKEMKVPYEVLVASAHRTPAKVEKYVKSARENGVEVLIAGAGMAAHLAGAVAAHTTLPVIGVPLKSGALNGIDALYSTVQMPTGIPVATVAVDGAKNAAFLACSILSIKYPEIAGRLEKYREAAREKMEKSAAELVAKL